MASQDINKLIRLAADGELDEQHRAEFERLKAVSPDETTAGMNIERDLRQLVARAMNNDSLPPSGLRQQIREGVKIDLEPWPSMNWKRSRSWLRPSGLAAGLLVVVSAAIVAGVMLERHGIGNGAAGSILRQEQATQQSLAEARRHITDDLQWGGAMVPDFSSYGYRLVSWLDFQTPPRSAKVCQLQFTGDHGVVNVWIEPYEVGNVGLMGQMVRGQAHQIRVPTQSADGSLDGAYAWIQGEFVYFLTTAEPDFGRKLSMAAGMPSTEPTIIPRQ